MASGKLDPPSLAIDSIIVLFSGPPQITYPQRHSVISLPVSMETALLGCRHIAHPNGTVVWTREGKALLLDAGKHRIFENGSLNILNMMPGDSGHYNCTISNMFGADSVTYTLLVIGRSDLVTPTACMHHCMMDGG